MLSQISPSWTVYERAQVAAKAAGGRSVSHHIHIRAAQSLLVLILD